MDGGFRVDTITITTTILKLIAEIDEFKGAWTAIGLRQTQGTLRKERARAYQRRRAPGGTLSSPSARNVVRRRRSHYYFFVPACSEVST
jgi:hypothetical protein